MTTKRIIPHSKIGKMIYFNRNELENWVTKHKRKTKEEIEQEADEYLIKKRK